MISIWITEHAYKLRWTYCLLLMDQIHFLGDTYLRGLRIHRNNSHCSLCEYASVYTHNSLGKKKKKSIIQLQNLLFIKKQIIKSVMGSCQVSSCSSMKSQTTWLQDFRAKLLIIFLHFWSNFSLRLYVTTYGGYTIGKLGFR